MKTWKVTWDEQVNTAVVVAMNQSAAIALVRDEVDAEFRPDNDTDDCYTVTELDTTKQSVLAWFVA